MSSNLTSPTVMEIGQYPVRTVFHWDNVIILRTCWFGHSLLVKDFVIFFPFLYAFMFLPGSIFTPILSNTYGYQLGRKCCISCAFKVLSSLRTRPSIFRKCFFLWSILFVFWMQNSASLPIANPHIDPLSYSPLPIATV